MLLVLLAAGCHALHNREAGPSSGLPDEAELRPNLVSAGKTADMQVAMGRLFERKGDIDTATAAYQAAIRHDPNRADALLRLGVLYDRQGRFAESAGFYRTALEKSPGNADIFCCAGYSHYLQGHWQEAEMNLRQALAIDGGHRRAHNNLGLLLACTNRPDEALNEFRLAGCTQADAQANLGFALALDGHLPEAQACYQQALRANPRSSAAQTGLQKLERLLAKQGPGSDSAPSTLSAEIGAASAIVAPEKYPPETALVVADVAP